MGTQRNCLDDGNKKDKDKKDERIKRIKKIRTEIKKDEINEEDKDEEESFIQTKKFKTVPSPKIQEAVDEFDQNDKHKILVMIRKWLKLNTSFIEVLKNSTVPKNLEQKWIFGNPSTCPGNIRASNCSSLDISLSFNTVPPPSAENINKSIHFIQTFSDSKEKGDSESQCSDSGGSETAVAETPAKTELFEVKGPNGTAFLIEVHAKDLEEVKAELMRLKGDHFYFDKTVIGWFTMKCILTAEPATKSRKDKLRLARVHAISCGCEEVYEGTGKFFFVNSLDRTIRAKRMLEKFGYTILGILYRFQPKEKVSLNDRVREVCKQFMEAVERLPKVISITHNL